MEGTLPYPQPAGGRRSTTPREQLYGKTTYADKYIVPLKSNRPQWFLSTRGVEQPITVYLWSPALIAWGGGGGGDSTPKT
jgi:hypothetical protein